ncbi:NADH-quinone oxidoreductase subunit C [Pseudovibrio sp. POLY-S9]|uniref:NADH-quinone oxidoreductase subunit C n=1 Tax=Pseudovibrio sp. POLY-S9 TaxID=1576596 RepID=UPI0007109560|nr:NADH-quinone oxidoreductase subunit C [Pseudovibrio sp. POLY-S9]
MKHLIETIKPLCEPYAMPEEGVRVDVSPAGLASTWMQFAQPSQFFEFATKMYEVGCRLATVTVYRPDPKGAPERHEFAYHFMLEGLPLTVRVIVEAGETLPSVTSLFPNADWEERELMELSDVVVTGHPDPRRLFLDESVDAGVFDRYVPFSELTNLANADGVWNRIREESRAKDAAEQTTETGNKETM